MDQIKKLQNIKSKIEEAKNKEAQTKGRLDTLMQRLSEEFNCKTTKEAEKKLKGIEIKSNKMSQTFENKFEELEENYDWE